MGIRTKIILFLFFIKDRNITYNKTRVTKSNILGIRFFINEDYIPLWEIFKQFNIYKNEKNKTATKENKKNNC